MDLNDLKVMDMGMRWKQQVKLKVISKFPSMVFIKSVLRNIFINYHFDY